MYYHASNVIELKRGLCLVRGEPGIGKTSVAKLIFENNHGKKNMIITYIPTANFPTKAAASKKMAEALSELGVTKTKNYADNVSNLQKGIKRAMEEKKNVVVLLDEGQLIHPSALVLFHELYNFDWDEKGIQVLIFGQPETSDIFEKNKALRERLYVDLSLTPLTITSATEMINFRLQIAGRKEPLTDDDALEIIYKISGGIPRMIVKLCGLSLDILIERKGKIIDTRIVEAAMEVYSG